MAKAQRGFSIGRVSARTGLSVPTIRFYEEKGLVASERTSGGTRTFSSGDIRRLSFVIAAQNLGFSLAEIKTQLSHLPDARTPTKADWARLAAEFAADIDARIAGLERLKNKLTGCMGCGCLSLDVCTLYNTNDKAAEDGAGPRYLLYTQP